MRGADAEAVPFVDADALARLLPMLEAIDALERAFRDWDPAAGPLRSHVSTPSGTLLLMPAVGEPGVGVKLVTLTDGNPDRGLPLIHALYVLFDPTTQAPRLLVDGSALTALRTAAVSGLATRHLAREDAVRLVIFGAGVQARAHLDAMAAVRKVSDVVIVGRSPSRVNQLVDVAASLGFAATVGGPDAVNDADIVCTCTTATEPLFEGSSLAAGAHINAVGAYQPQTREIDNITVERARVVVETREVAMEEAGDLLIPIGEGTVDAEHIVADLRQVVQGATVRSGERDITLFESVGMAFEDLAVAGALAART
ncbi:MAG: ornithine cyclodeaminase family protein [Actinomycetota bacterium]|nr:ornithine cyclodeaminase family protein [Actinomycetota bacterium]MDH5224226.1 ornithine cyclodeaminase family protein [Actinomycetota bacterium]MDH5312967.1 ornithine cyclodeaminase family protein [Actinomycetota bacterium]